MSTSNRNNFTPVYYHCPCKSWRQVVDLMFLDSFLASVPFCCSPACRRSHAVGARPIFTAPHLILTVNSDRNSLDSTSHGCVGLPPPRNVSVVCESHGFAVAAPLATHLAPPPPLLFELSTASFSAMTLTNINRELASSTRWSLRSSMRKTRVFNIRLHTI
jgi:hypothetical protein